MDHESISVKRRIIYGLFLQMKRVSFAFTNLFYFTSVYEVGFRSERPISSFMIRLAFFFYLKTQVLKNIITMQKLPHSGGTNEKDGWVQTHSSHSRIKATYHMCMCVHFSFCDAHNDIFRLRVYDFM